MVPLRQAMESLRGMFPQVDPEVVRTVLESHNGHMEQAVESLLVITGDHRGEGSGVRAPPIGMEPFEQAGASGTQTHEQIHRDELLAARLHHQLNTESEDDWSPWCAAPVSGQPVAESRNEAEAYPTQDLQQTLSSGWQWMQDSTTWLGSYISESLGEMIEEPGTNPTADLQIDVTSPTARGRSHERERFHTHSSSLSREDATAGAKRIPAAKRPLPIGNISSDTIRDRRTHATEEITPHEDGQKSPQSSRNNLRQPEINPEDDTLEAMTTDVLEFLGVVDEEPPPKRDSKKDK
eukprot:2737019-Pyramimonas_sp.AAC.1